MKIGITGSNGYIGKECIKYLKNKYTIIALHRQRDVKQIEGITYRYTDYSLDSLQECFENVDAIVHLAAQKVVNDEKNGLKEYEASISLTETIYKAALKNNIKNIINMSSRCVYGMYTPTKFTETDQTNPINFYGLSKIVNEQISEYYNKKYSLYIKTLRLGQVIGNDLSPKSMFNTFFKNALNGSPLNVIGNEIRDYIYIDDVCKAIDCALQAKEQGGIYNISTGVGVNNRDAAQCIVGALHSKSYIICDNDSILKSRIILNCDKAKNILNFSCTYENFAQISHAVIKHNDITEEGTRNV